MATSTIDGRGDQVNLFMIQGNTFEVTITVKDNAGNSVDLSDYTVRAQFRRSYSAPGAPVIDLTEDNQGIVITNPAQGEIVMYLRPEFTTPIRFGTESPDEIELVYDIEMENTALDIVFKPCYGTLTIQREVTRG